MKLGKIFAVGILLLMASSMAFASGQAGGAGGGAAATAVTGPFDWKRFAGEEISVYMVTHQTVDALLTKIDDFQKLTGIKVNTQVTPEANYFDQVTNALSSRSGTPDLFMSGAYQLWDYSTAGNVEALDAYLNNPSLTNKDYDPADFVPSAFNALKWDGIDGHAVGAGKQLGIPLGMELYMLAYNQRAFDKAGITKAPQTYDELLTVIDKIQNIPGGWNGPGSYAIAVRGARDWGTIHPAYMSTYVNFGAKDFVIENGKLVSKVNSPESVKMNTFFVDMIRRGGSPQWSTQYWYMCLADFGAGKAAILWDASNCEPQVDFQPMAEAGNIRYVTMPIGKVGDKINSNFWTWSMAMNSYSKHKGAAWTFLQYFSSKDFLIYASTTMNNMDPTRTSVYNNAAFQAKINKLPGWYDAWQKTVPGTTIQFTPQKAFFQTTTEWAAALQDMVAGRKTIQQALDDLKKLQDTMVQE